MAGVAFGEEVFDQAHADVVAHAVEFGVDGGVVGFAAGGGEGEVAAEGGDDGAVGEGDDFGVDFVDAGSFARRLRVSWIAYCILCVISSRIGLLTSILCAAVSQLGYFYVAGAVIIAAHSSPTRAYLLDAMVFYGVCTLSCRARKRNSQLITCKARQRRRRWIV